MNALLDETRSERIDLGLPFMKQLRLSPTVQAVLAEEKPGTMTWADFALTAMIEKCIASRMLRGDVAGANRLLVRLFGQPAETPDVRQEDLAPVRKPLATARR